MEDHPESERVVARRISRAWSWGPNLAGALLLALLAGSASAQGLDAPLVDVTVGNITGNSCLIQVAIDQIARAAQVPLGFETVEGCVNHHEVRNGPQMPLTGLTARAALDRVLAVDGVYIWKEIDGAVVVRPKAAWDDLDDALNGRTGAFSVTRASPVETVHALLQASVDLVWPTHAHMPNGDVRLNVSFDGGTVIQALSAIIVANQGYWHFEPRGAAGYLEMDALNSGPRGKSWSLGETIRTRPETAESKAPSPQQPVPSHHAKGLDTTLGTLPITDIHDNACLTYAAVDQITRAIDVPLGFEADNRCSGGRGLSWAFQPGSETLNHIAARDAIDYVLAIHGTYTWAEMGGTVVVRPRNAWDDPRDPLNRQTRVLNAKAAEPIDVIDELTRAAVPSLAWPRGHEHVNMPDERFSIAFGGGTFLDALNALVSSNGKAWHVEWVPGEDSAGLWIQPVFGRHGGYFERLFVSQSRQARVPTP